MNPIHCPTCHTLIPENAPGGFCPLCLLRDAETPHSHDSAVPPIEKIAAAFPQWEILELIGRGGMGFVYKVRQPSLDRTVALKILSPELGRDPAFAERFAREARTLGKLHHPNIVTVFEHGEKDGFFYLLMEYVDGVNLRQAMRAGRFSPEQALAIVPGICDALQSAHAQGIWHRDIKPENILLDNEGKVKIVDFGIARIVGDPQRDFTLTHTGNALGSFSYMAPEQHEKPHDVDHRADIYSLGVVIYEMLTGELPLGRFPAPSQKSAVDARIDEIVFKTLEKERELRQQSANEVKTDVHGMMTSAAPAAIAAQSSGSRIGTSGFRLMIAAVVLPFILSAISARAAELGFILSMFLLVIAFVLGVLGWKQTLGKVAAIGSGLVLLVYGLFLLVTQMGTPPSMNQDLSAPSSWPHSVEKTMIVDTPAQKALRKKLDTIILPRLDFTDTSIEEAVDFLRTMSAEHDDSANDPNEKGVNFVIMPSDTESDPAKSRVSRLVLKNVTLGAALKQICEMTNTDMRVDDYAIILIPRK